MSARLFIATRKGLFTASRNGQGESGWRLTQNAFLGDNVSMVLPDSREDAVYAALDHGHFGVKMHRSRNGGREWEECATPIYPPRPEGDVTPDAHGGPGAPWRLLRVWSLERGHSDQPGELWCGTIPGGLFRSRDQGSSWEMVRSLWDHPMRAAWFGGGADEPGIHSICVDPRDARKVTLGVSCGGVWMTEDDGETWECRSTGMRADYMPPDKQYEPGVQDPHRVVQCRARPECLWVQHHNGVFRSTDGARSWHEVPGVPPSVFGFAVAVHPHDPDTAWFVPAIKDERRIPVDGKVVVTRTRDGGQSFEVFREGLPQEHAYDIVYRHALDVDGRGECLAMGSTTGALWVSNDAGVSWHCLGQHLPPIYCVRFAA